MSGLWVALLVAAVGSYLTKLAGLSLPESVLAHPRVQRVAGLLPVAMLAALVAVQLADGGGRYALDFSHYEPVPAAVQQKLVDAYKPGHEDE